MTQVFDVLVDKNGDYLMGGHTTVGNGVVNWDYVALKVNGQTRSLEWRKTWGQPRGFDPQWIHDEMYGVDLDLAGNYLLLGGFGDKGGNSAGEYLSVDQQTGEVMIYVDADTIGGGYGFMKLSPDTSNPAPPTTTSAPTPGPTTTTTASTPGPTTTTAAPTPGPTTTTSATPTTTTDGGDDE